MSEQWPYQKLTLEQAAQVKPVLAHDAVGNEVREGDVLRHTEDRFGICAGILTRATPDGLRDLPGQSHPLEPETPWPEALHDLRVLDSCVLCCPCGAKLLQMLPGVHSEETACEPEGWED